MNSYVDTNSYIHTGIKIEVHMNSYLDMNSHIRMGVLELKLQHGHMNSYQQI